MLGIAAALSMWLAATVPASSQTSGCALVADDRNPPEKILRCGANLEVRAAAGTIYHPIDQRGSARPKSLQLDDGALMIEFHPSKRHTSFQILTPHAIAAVRGTKWIVEVGPERTSTLVISGRVAVSRPRAEQTVVLRPGEGADVSPGEEPIAVKRWAEKRVRALLARFGE
ncbi:MAG: FecR family protein [Roseiarcus sp.]|jgi:hypothetical protein